MYATVEDVIRAGLGKLSLGELSLTKRALETASADVDSCVSRTEGSFRPHYATYYFPWPPHQTSATDTLWLDALGLISVQSITTNGSALTAGQYILEPTRYGPPFNRVRLAPSAAFSSADDNDRSIVITGLWGYTDVRELVGPLPLGINATTAVISLNDGSLVGIGDHLIIDDERLIVTGKTAVTYGNSLTPLTSSAAANVVAVAVGTDWHSGEIIMIDSETMIIVNVLGDNLVVKRAYQGSTLAAHDDNAPIYSERTLTVTRGAQGSIAAPHLASASIYRHVVPFDVSELAVASAMTTLLSGFSGYTREYGPEGVSTKLGSGIEQLRQRVIDNHGRKARSRVV